MKTVLYDAIIVRNGSLDGPNELFRLAQSMCDVSLKSILAMNDKMNMMNCPNMNVYKSDDDNKCISTFCFENEALELFFVVRVYKVVNNGDPLIRVSLNIEGPSDDENAGTGFVLQYVDTSLMEEKIGSEIKNFLSSGYVDATNCMPLISRGVRFSPYLKSADERIFEYKFADVLFDETSDFQRVSIVNTLDFGNILILDKFVNLAVSDTFEYTHTLMNLPHENYEGKTVLILGGGDGGLLKELMELSKPPSFVTMVEIDEMVIDACSIYMRQTCGNWLDKDQRASASHQIIVGDAIAYMDKELAMESKFDYIFGDLTEIPVSNLDDGSKMEDNWQFIESIINKAVHLLKPKTGKYLTHCNGVNVPKALAYYEEKLKKLECTFTKSECFVKSFMETWVFYQVTRN